MINFFYIEKNQKEQEVRQEEEQKEEYEKKQKKEDDKKDKRDDNSENRNTEIEDNSGGIKNKFKFYLNNYIYKSYQFKIYYCF